MRRLGQRVATLTTRRASTAPIITWTRWVAAPDPEELDGFEEREHDDSQERRLEQWNPNRSRPPVPPERARMQIYSFASLSSPSTTLIRFDSDGYEQRSGVNQY